MTVSFRDQLQEKWALDFMNSNRFGILHLCPRAGKIRTSIRIFCKLQRELKRVPRILILYPDKNIQESWESDFVQVGYKNPYVTYFTHISISKATSTKDFWDMIVIDEIHLLSAKQKSNLKSLMSRNKSAVIIGLSGTLSNQTEQELKQELKLPVLMSYTLDEAINDGLISDYQIKIIKTPLNNQTILYKNKNRTEKAQYAAYTYVIEKQGQNLLLNLARMRVIHNSLAKTESTKHLLNSLRNERVLVFCANNKVAKSLGCIVHTSKFNNQADFDKFILGKGNKHLAVCKIGNTGVSFKNLDHIIVNAFDSNSENLTQRICRSLILDEKGKISNIYIITSDEKAELRWLEKSLEFFDKTKIKY